MERPIVGVEFRKLRSDRYGQDEWLGWMTVAQVWPADLAYEFADALAIGEDQQAALHAEQIRLLKGSMGLRISDTNRLMIRWHSSDKPQDMHMWRNPILEEAGANRFTQNILRRLTGRMGRAFTGTPWEAVDLLEPSYFWERVAGLTVMRIVDEPPSWVLTYGEQPPNETGNEECECGGELEEDDDESESEIAV